MNDIEHRSHKKVIKKVRGMKPLTHQSVQGLIYKLPERQRALFDRNPINGHGHGNACTRHAIDWTSGTARMWIRNTE